MNKEEVLKECIEQGNEYGYLNYDGILDICDEESELVNYCVDEINKMINEGKVKFDYW